MNFYVIWVNETTECLLALSDVKLMFFGLWDWNSHHSLIDCYWALKLCHVFHLKK